MQKTIEKYFPRQVDSLNDLFAFFDELGPVHGYPEALLFNIKLCIEELFVNMVKYQPGSGHPVFLRLEIDVDRLIITLVDRDVDFFDVSRPRTVDTRAPLEERKPGGLGIYLVHQLMDEVTYDYKDRVSTIRLLKKVRKHANPGV